MMTFAKVAITVAATAAMSLGAAAPASAAIGDISGSDPAATGCSSGAYTIASRAILDNSGHNYGTMEVRWSPSCQTNWVRVTPAPGLTGQMSKYIFRGKSYLSSGGALMPFSNTTIDTATVQSYGMQAYVPLNGDNQCVTVSAKYIVGNSIIASTGTAQTAGQVTIC